MSCLSDDIGGVEKAFVLAYGSALFDRMDILYSNFIPASEKESYRKIFETFFDRYNKHVHIYGKDDIDVYWVIENLADVIKGENYECVLDTLRPGEFCPMGVRITVDRLFVFKTHIQTVIFDELSKVVIDSKAEKEYPILPKGVHINAS
jgi:hypothetical protein